MEGIGKEVSKRKDQIPPIIWKEEGLKGVIKEEGFPKS